MLFLSLIAVAAAGSMIQPAAALRVTGEQSTFALTVKANETGYQVAFECVATCPSRIFHSEHVDDTPLGLFTRDQDQLVFSLWSAGSAYRVRVWRVTDKSITKVAELSSRGRPDILSSAGGYAAIRTYEGESGVGPLKPVLWTYAAGHFSSAKQSSR